MGRRQNKLGQMCDILETVWSEPGSPVDEHSPSITTNNNNSNIKNKRRMDNQKGRHKSSRMSKMINGTSAGGVSSNGNTTKTMKTKAFFAALDSMLGQNINMDSPEGDPDEFFLLPDRVLAVDSLTFREELAAVAPAFLSPVTPTTPGSSSKVFGGINGHNNNTSFGKSPSGNCNQRNHGFSHSHLPHKSSSLDSNRSTDSNRSSVRLADDTEGLIITRACNGSLWLCK